jgi:hypothetical protein
MKNKKRNTMLKIKRNHYPISRRIKGRKTIVSAIDQKLM